MAIGIHSEFPALLEHVLCPLEEIMRLREFGLRLGVAAQHGLDRLSHRLDSSEERGASAVEYALLVALIAVIIIVAVRALGGAMNDKFTQVASAVATAA